MSHDVADKALAGYFDDLLADEAEVDGIEEVAEPEEIIETPQAVAEVRGPLVKSEPPEVAVEAPPIAVPRETDSRNEAREPELSTEPGVSSESILESLKDAAPPNKNRPQTLQEKAEEALRSLPEPEPSPPKVTRVSPPPIAQRKPAEETQAKSFVSENLATLEAQKKKLLQRMLAQQAVTEVKPKIEQKAELKVEQEVKVEPKVKEEVKVAPAVTEAPPVVKETVEERVEVAPTEVISTEVEAQEAVTDDFLTWGENGRPRWAENNFEVLLFEVAGLSLAVPLVALGQIVPLDKKLTFLQGQSDWFMGLLPSTIGDIRTINTALFVMPERNNADFADNAKYVVTIDGFSWGLAVDNVKQPISLAPDDVKWRSERSKRPWLAGTVKSHMCALIDIPQMAELLEGSDHNRPH